LLKGIQRFKSTDGKRIRSSGMKVELEAVRQIQYQFGVQEIVVRLLNACIVYCLEVSAWVFLFIEVR
jgi:hypothetical protein